MNQRLTVTILVAISWLTLEFIQTIASPLGTAFTYQAQLKAGGNPANGVFDFTFSLYDASSGGSKYGNTQTNSSTSVTNGLLLATIDFGGGVFGGLDYWLEIGMRTNGSSSFTILSPRQHITPTPYAIAASNLTGKLPASQLTGTLPSSALSGTYSGVVQFSNTGNTFKGDGSGLTGITATGYPTNHYFFAYANTTQTATAGFTTIAFNTVPYSAGWTIGSGGYAFTAPASGLYLVEYHVQASTTSTGVTLSLRASLNGAATEITGSQSAGTIQATGQTMNIGKTFLVQLSAGDTISLQFAASTSGFASIAPSGQGTVRPSASLTVIRIK